MKHLASQLLTVAKSVLARAEVLDLDRIAKLRSDFLMLMKAARRVSNYTEAMRVKGYIGKWSKDFDDYMYKYFQDQFANMKFREEVSESDWKYWDKLIRENTWPFYMEFSMPISKADSYYTEEMRFAKFQEELPKWEARVKRKALLAWKTLNNFVEWYALEGELPAKPFTVDVPIPESVMMEGFSVTLSGHDHVKKSAEYIELFRAGLKVYRAKASAVYPWLIQNQLPLVLDFKAGMDIGGLYERDHIRLNGYQSGNPEHVAHVLAHEMSHHRYRSIGRAAQDYWERMIIGDLGELDLKTLTEKYPDKYHTWDNKYIKNESPFLYQQLNSLQHSPSVPKAVKDANDIGDIREYLEKGGQTKVTIVRHPISGYASKNPEEAFCEALGYLVAFGPSRVPDIVLGWLKDILLSVKTASRIAHRPIKVDEAVVRDLIKDFFEFIKVSGKTHGASDSERFQPWDESEQ